MLPHGERFRLVFAGNHAQGTIFKDGTHLATPQLLARLHEIACRLLLGELSHMIGGKGVVGYRRGALRHCGRQTENVLGERRDRSARARTDQNPTAIWAAAHARIIAHLQTIPETSHTGLPTRARSSGLISAPAAPSGSVMRMLPPGQTGLPRHGFRPAPAEADNY